MKIRYSLSLVLRLVLILSLTTFAYPLVKFEPTAQTNVSDSPSEDSKEYNGSTDEIYQKWADMATAKTVIESHKIETRSAGLAFEGFERERSLDRAAAKVNPDSPQADRIYREAATATRERIQSEQKAAEPSTSKLDRAVERERSLDRAAEKVDPNSPQADRIYREAATATRERVDLERQPVDRLERVVERERSLDTAARRVRSDDPSSDRIYRDAANTTRERRQLEQQLEQQKVAKVETRLPAPYPGKFTMNPEFYDFRANDYKARTGREHSYYVPFGKKYLNRFNSMARTESAEVRNFVNKTGPLLQRKIENARMLDPVRFAAAERSRYLFRGFINRTHIEAYNESGWQDLSFNSQRRIGRTIDIWDVRHPSSIIATVILLRGVNFPPLVYPETSGMSRDPSGWRRYGW